MRHLLRSLGLALLVGFCLPLLSAQVAAKDAKVNSSLLAPAQASSSNRPASDPKSQPSSTLATASPPQIAPVSIGTLARARLVPAPEISAGQNIQPLGMPQIQSAVAAQAGVVVTVDTTTTVIDGDTTNVSNLLNNPGTDQQISFAEAIAAINATGAGNTIRFNLPHGATINSSGPFFLTAASTTIDGDVDGDGKPDVVLDAPNGQAAINISSDGNTIANLAIVAVVLQGVGAHHNHIIGCYIGTDVDGLAARPKGTSGITIRDSAQANIVEQNIIAGNSLSGGDAGVIIALGAHNNQIRGNRIGLNAAGNPLPNDYGVVVFRGAPQNIVGGSHATDACDGECNLISANKVYGVLLQDPNTSGNQVQGNFIGVTLDGMQALPNEFSGVAVLNGASQNRIGDEHAASGCVGAYNLISGNIDDGVMLSDAGTNGNIVVGNWIGLNRLGTAAIPNQLSGVEVSAGASQNSIGKPRSTVSCTGLCNVISGNGQNGILLSDAGTIGNQILGNHIGLTAAGTGALPNHGSGIKVQNGSSNNLIGDSRTSSACDGPCNIIGGNAEAGVALLSAGTTNNQIRGNYIGLDATSTMRIPNELSGIRIASSASQNTIGGQRSGIDCSGPCNVISGGHEYGVAIQGAGTAGNSIQGNYIGLDPAGAQPIGNAQGGVAINNGAQENRVGSDQPGDRPSVNCTGPCNVISGNAKHGIEVFGLNTSANKIQGNYVGLNALGTTALPNQNSGVFVYGSAAQNLIGGERPVADCTSLCNAISGNRDYGIVLADSGTIKNAIKGNVIGIDPIDATQIGNQAGGIQVSTGASQNLIGGERAAGPCIGSCNIIRGNFGAGVQVIGTSRAITIRGNVIAGYAIDPNHFTPGIDLGGDGVTLNDAGDGDTGPNDLLNAPLSLAADFDGTKTTISGVISSGVVETTTVQIDIYGGMDVTHNPSDLSVYLGSVTPQADGSFSLVLNGDVSTYPTYSATATDANGNTSEISLKTPVIFVPGAAASTLVDQANGNEELWLGSCLPPFCNTFRRRLRITPGDKIVATDAMRYGPLRTKIHGPFLEQLVSQGHYQEYNVNNDPDRRTAAGCDVAGQKASLPNLFVFAYDWRQGIEAPNGGAPLLKAYMECVQRFYPGARVNIVTHSMGSLVARRYILDNPGTHHVQRLITMAAPWLGAPKMLYVLETGDFIPFIAAGSGVQYAMESLPGVHELMPTPPWFNQSVVHEIAGCDGKAFLDRLMNPLIECGVDYDGNGKVNDVFEDYDILVAAVNKRHPEFTPGATNQAFHTPLQDFQVPDTSGVRYFHLYGTQFDYHTIKRILVKMADA